MIDRREGKAGEPMSTWAVGQQVILRERMYREIVEREATIARVGRTYVYVMQHGREVAFHASDGVEKGEGNYLGRIFTAESLAEHHRLLAVSKRLSDVTDGWSWKRRLSVDDMEQIIAIIEGSAQ